VISSHVDPGLPLALQRDCVQEAAQRGMATHRHTTVPTRMTRKVPVQAVDDWLSSVQHNQGQGSVKSCSNCCCISGPPGCGRSTTIRLLAKVRAALGKTCIYMLLCQSAGHERFPRHVGHCPAPGCVNAWYRFRPRRVAEGSNRGVLQEHGCSIDNWAFPTVTLWNEHKHLGALDTQYMSKVEAFRELVDRSKLNTLPLTRHLSNPPPANGALSLSQSAGGAASMATQRSPSELQSSAAPVVDADQAAPPHTATGQAVAQNPPITIIADFPHLSGMEAREQLCDLLVLLAQSASKPVIVLLTESGAVLGRLAIDVWLECCLINSLLVFVVLLATMMLGMPLLKQCT
jgi:hypothetical protein